MQSAFGNDFVLRAKLTASKEDGDGFKVAFERLQSNGLRFGLRTYWLFGFKEEHRKKRRGIQSDGSHGVLCTFLCLQSEAGDDLLNAKFPKFPDIHAARLFMGHWVTEPYLAKRVARFRLCLSKTHHLEGIDWSKLRVILIPDCVCKDATGVPILDKNGKVQLTTDGCHLR